MYYRLKDDYSLRGWKYLPFAIYDNKKKEAVFLDEKSFSFIKLCDGEHPIDINKLSSNQKKELDSLIKSKLVEKRENALKLNDNQKYKKYPSRYIRSVHWSITGRCNYKCRHCLMSAPEAGHGELSFPEIKKIINELKECGIYSVDLTGGEPLYRDDFFEILDALSDANIKVGSIYTNGKLVNNRLFDELESRNMKPAIVMSYDGKGWHDWMRGIPGAEKYVIDAFRLCQERGFDTSSAMCIHRGNKDVFCETVDELASVGCESLQIGATSLIGNWKKSLPKYRLSNKEIYDTYLEYIKQFFENGMKITIKLGGAFSCAKGSMNYMIPFLKFKPGEDYLKMAVCGHVRNFSYISPEGTVLPCMALAESENMNDFPNILNKKLSEILDDSYYMKVITTNFKEYFDQNPECDICEYRDSCAGGCRGVADTDGLGYMDKDPKACFFFTNRYHEKVKAVADSIISSLKNVNSKEKVKC